MSRDAVFRHMSSDGKEYPQAEKPYEDKRCPLKVGAAAAVGSGQAYDIGVKGGAGGAGYHVYIGSGVLRLGGFKEDKGRP